MDTEPWASDHARDATMVAALVGGQFPDLSPVNAVYLDEGWDSVVYEVNGSWIFRFPKRPEVVGCHDAERALLPRLAVTLPLPIPLPSRDGRPALGYPFRFMGYQRLRGTPAILLPLDAVDVDACGTQLGGFLTSLHAFPSGEAAALGVPSWSMEGRFERWRAAMLERLEGMASELSPRFLARTRAFLEGSLPTSVPASAHLVHYDLCDGHVLVDEGARRACGVIDWGDVCVGDAAMDFAGLWQWQGERLVERALRSYRGATVDDAFLARAKAAATIIALSTLWYGVAGKRPEFVASGLRSLEHTLPAG